MTSRRTVKICAAIIGGTAVVTIGALDTTIVQQGAVDLAKSPAMTTGATTTATKPPKAPAVAQAVPKIKGPAPLPSEEQAAK